MFEVQMVLPEVEASGVVVAAAPRRRGRPSTGCAMSAAERMRNMRARRKAQGKLFVSQVQPVTEIRATVETVRQVQPVTKNRAKVAGYLVTAIRRYHVNAVGDRSQRACADFEFDAIVLMLVDLGGMAGEW